MGSSLPVVLTVPPEFFSIGLFIDETPLKKLTVYLTYEAGCPECLSRYGVDHHVDNDIFLLFPADRDTELKLALKKTICVHRTVKDE